MGQIGNKQSESTNKPIKFCFACILDKIPPEKIKILENCFPCLNFSIFLYKVFWSFAVLLVCWWGVFPNPWTSNNQGEGDRKSKRKKKGEHKTRRSEDKPISSLLKLEVMVSVSINNSGTFYLNSILFLWKIFSTEK